jgi:hypothetical protein
MLCQKPEARNPEIVNNQDLHLVHLYGELFADQRSRSIDDNTQQKLSIFKC